jgi:hypothetical protein
MTTPIPAQGAGRIRWADESPQEFVTLAGYIGTRDEPAFRIFGPDAVNCRWLLSVRLAAASEFIYGSGPDELKATAERWLEEFVSSLGASFPPGEISDDQDGEPLEVKYAAGRRVRYAHPENGYPGESQAVGEALTLGAVYVIAWADISQSRTDLSLYRGGAFGREVIGRFNSVFFELADDEDGQP